MNSKYLKILLFTGAVLLVIFLISARSFFYTKKVTLVKENQNFHSLVLIVQNGEKIKPVGMSFDYVLTGNSADKKVTGIDVVVRFDPKIVVFQGIRPFDSNYDFIATPMPNGVYITGSRKLDKEPQFLKNSSLAIVTFKAISVGNPHMAMEFTNNGNKKDSNMIDTSSNDILNTAVIDKIGVGTMIEIQKGVPFSLGNNATLLLKDILLAEKNCRDCTTMVKVLLTTRSGSKEFKIKLNDQASNADKISSFGNFEFYIDSLMPNSVLVIYAKGEAL